MADIIETGAGGEEGEAGEVDLVDSATAQVSASSETSAVSDALIDAEALAWEANARAIAQKIQIEYEEEAKKVAEKVRRQQEGQESAMLGSEHADEEYQTVDAIKRMLEAQMLTNAKTSQAGTYSRKEEGGMRILATYKPPKQL